MTFFQAPPQLGNQYTDDSLLRSYLERTLPPDVLRAVEPQLSEMGALAGGKLRDSMLTDLRREPELVHWDAWGHRVDRIDLVPHWKLAAEIAASRGVVAAAYDKQHGPFARIHQFALVYLFDGSSGTYTCPLAMTDGAARTLLSMGNAALIDRAVPRLLSRDPASAWTSGQWMTERTGGSDVAISESVARPDAATGLFRLYGTKWFSSATTSQMALTLARPEGNPPGGSGLALFYVEMRGSDGALNGIEVNRLKDKLGTRMLPTAELNLTGALATPVRGLSDGIRNITPMLQITRTWNAVCATGGLRRGMALSRDYAKRRVAFGAPLADKPLHVDTLAGIEAELHGAFLLTFRVVELLGKEEAGVATDAEVRQLRLLTPLAKLCTARQAVAGLSEVVEGFGGAGYVEDTGIPRLLRDAQVLSIWEGTTNVLALDVLRALGKSGSADALAEDLMARARAGVPGTAEQVGRALGHATEWIERARGSGQEALEAGARRFALTLARAAELALLGEHAQWMLRVKKDGRAAAAARRLARHGVDLIADDAPAADAVALAMDRPLAP